MGVKLRVAALDDAPALLQLAIELGYVSDVTEIRERIALLARLPDHQLLVADDGTRAVGFIHVRVSHQLESPSFAEIAGLTVGDKARSAGVGTRLVAAAEDWARRRGLRAVRVRSNLKRVRTHGFYRRCGFEESKDQKVFVKRLGSV